MPSLRLTTYNDLTTHVIDYFGAAVDERNLRYARRAVQMAYYDVANSKTWAYYFKNGTITTVGAYNTGTIAYDNTAKTVTLSGGSWPSWAALGTILINNVPYDVATRTSATVLTLGAANPGADVTAGASYTIYQDAYQFPVDFLNTDEMVNFSNPMIMSYLGEAGWLALHRVMRTAAVPTSWCIFPSHKSHGILEMRVYPFPDTAYRLDFIYQRRPRPLTIDSYDVGSASITVLGSATLTGTGTSWNDCMVGSVLRLSSSRTEAVTGAAGDNPPVLERVITAVASATSLTLDAVADTTYTNVKYSISDPVDIEQGAMLTYLLRECEYQARAIKRMDTTAEEQRRYTLAQHQAWEADNRSRERKAEGQSNWYPMRLRDMPLGANA